MKLKNAHRVDIAGFTLVELSIVTVVIGLLVGGTLAGMRLVENSRTHKTIQQMKAIESATLTFRDVYRGLPGDLRNPSTRLADCLAMPCSRSGDGNRIIGTMNNPTLPANPTNTENYAFWSHLRKSELYDTNTYETMNFQFGHGQPNIPISKELGFKVGDQRQALFGVFGCTPFSKLNGTALVLATIPNGSFSGLDISYGFRCSQMRKIDNALDDDSPSTGRFQVLGCSTNFACGPGLTPGYTTENTATWTMGGYYALRGL